MRRVPSGGASELQRVVCGPADGRNDVPPGAPTGDPSSTMVYNNDYNLCFECYKDNRDAAEFVFKAKVARANAGNVTPDNMMCPAYHISGQCNFGCSRAKDHRTHSANQLAILVIWAEEQTMACQRSWQRRAVD